MSTILKALRKLEEEKREETPLPSLDAKALVTPGEPLHRPARGRPLVLVTGLGALLVAVVAAGWWWMGRGPAAVVPASAPVGAIHGARHAPPQREAAAPAPAPAPAHRQAAVAPPASAAAVAAGLAAVRPSVAGASPPAPAGAPAAMPAPPPTRQATPSLALHSGAQAPSPAPEAPARAAAPPAPSPRESHPARRAEAPVAARHAPTRAAREPTHVVRSRAKPAPVPDVAVVPPPPKVEVDQIVWRPDPDRRVATVHVAGRAAPLQLHEGDAVGTLVVQEIDPGAVIFLDGTSRVRIGLGETP